MTVRVAIRRAVNKMEGARIAFFAAMDSGNANPKAVDIFPYMINGGKMSERTRKNDINYLNQLLHKYRKEWAAAHYASRSVANGAPGIGKTSVVEPSIVPDTAKMLRDLGDFVTSKGGWDAAEAELSRTLSLIDTSGSVDNLKNVISLVKGFIGK